MTLPIEFDRDLRRHFLKRRVHFLGGVSQAARIDVDANAAAGTPHVFTRLQSLNALFKVVTAARALKFDHAGIDARHQRFFPRWPIFRRPASYRAESLILGRAMINVRSSYGRLRSSPDAYHLRSLWDAVTR